MILGVVTARYDAIVRLSIRGTDGAEIETETVVDTGFNHELTLPPKMVQHLQLAYVATVQADLAAEVKVRVDYYRAVVVWDGQLREVAVLEMEGAPLVGMGLVAGFRLTIDGKPGGEVRFERLEAP